MATDGRGMREARARFLLGLLLSEIFKDECAAELLGDAIDYAPDLAAARVELGVVYCQQERYAEMLGEFREAVSTDPRAVRAAVGEEPRELEHLRGLVYPRQDATDAAVQIRAPAIPSPFRESGELVELGREQIAQGCDAAAVATLEAALKLDATHRYAVALLALAYVLLGREAGVTTAEAGGSVLWEAEPALAGLLFKRRGSTPSNSH